MGFLGRWQICNFIFTFAIQNVTQTSAHNKAIQSHKLPSYSTATQLRYQYIGNFFTRTQPGNQCNELHLKLKWIKLCCSTHCSSWCRDGNSATATHHKCRCSMVWTKLYTHSMGVWFQFKQFYIPYLRMSSFHNEAPTMTKLYRLTVCNSDGVHEWQSKYSRVFTLELNLSDWHK